MSCCTHLLLLCVFRSTQVLEVLLGAVSVQAGQSVSQRAANCTAVAMAALAGLGPLVRRSRTEGAGSAGAGQAGDKVASKVLQLASCMLEDQVGVVVIRGVAVAAAVALFKAGIG